MCRSIKAVVAALTLINSGLAIGGIADTPLPIFSDGTKAKLVLSASGVIANFGGLATSFHCTNLDSKSANIGVEIFQFSGTVINSISSGEGVKLNVAPGAERTFSTQSTAAFFDDSVILSGDVVDQGSARIVSTSTKVICSATILDPVNAPPTSMVSLPLLKGKVQKGN